MINLGPLALAMERLIAVLGVAAFMAAASWIARHSQDSEKAAWRAVLVGLIAARLGFVVQNWSAFVAEPLSVLYVWQGGFLPLVGLAAGAVVLVLFLRRSPALMRTGIAFAGSAAVSLAATALFHASMQRPWPNGLVLHSLAGQAAPLDDLKGRVHVINLWATWCPPCQREMPMLTEAAERSTVPILLVNQGEETAKVTAWLGRQGLASAHVFLDRDQSAGAAAGSAGLPTTLFVDSRGVIRERHAGEISRAGLLAGLRKLD